MKILASIIVICIIFSFAIIPNVFGHGLGGEVLPPIIIDNKQASLSISITPSVFDENPEKYISLRLFDSNTDAIIEHVTFEFELKKDGKQIFKDIFHDELGNLNIKVLTDNSNDITIEGIKEPVLGGWMKSDSNPLTLRGPAFTSGGLYEYTVKILSINSDSNIINEEIILDGGISIAQTNYFNVNDYLNEEKTLQVISYFDTINNFNFESNTIEFSMPFDWNQDLEQLSVVHQEIRVPNTFGDFLSTRYDSTVNGILLPDESVTIDDYSFEDRTIHIVVNQELIKQIQNEAIQISDTIMNFHLRPSEIVKFPLEFVTPDLRYKVFLSWEPEIIHTEDEITFFVAFEEIFSDKSKKLVEYDLSIIQKNNEIFSKHLAGNVNSEKPNSHKITFSDEQSGTANFVLSNIGGNSLSKGNFILVIQPPSDIQNDSSTIPEWIKNNAAWWSEGTIDDDSFIQGIQFLIKEGILQIPYTTQGSSSTSNQIPEWIKNNAAWWSEGTIDDDSFIQGIQFLIKEGILQITS
ncbi:peptidase [Nitrosopumilus sp.]|uniref:peptidase n=1 Tax=Nitrosopumilus sp. TaxID=2024843 RepID=UPI002616C4E7|nr:peptidase [Nitrosopumilus sp.]